VVEANGTCLSIPIFRFATVVPGIPENMMEKLHMKLDSAHIRSQVQLKGFRTWNLELKFCSQGPRCDFDLIVFSWHHYNQLLSVLTLNINIQMLLVSHVRATHSRLSTKWLFRPTTTFLKWLTT
jgi:hypothetical protein